VRRNRPIKAAPPRHRKAGPARVGGDDVGGKRTREIGDEGIGEATDDREDGSWPRTASGR
jgi:hypothetical protein